MLHIGSLFHVAHVISDLERAEAFYDRVFSPQYMFRGDHSTIEGRDASLLLFSDFVSEPMAPIDIDGNVARFHGRFGQRLHSIALYSNDIVEIWSRLRSEGVRVTDGKGPVEAPPERTAIYTHPRDTFGILEFMAPRVPGGHGGQASADDALGDCYDPRLLGSYSPDFWRFEHPMKIQRSHMTVLVRDMGAARALYVDLLEGDPLHEDKHTCHDTHSLFVALGSDPVVVELARPLTHESSEARELEKNGEMLYSVTFQVSDLEAAEAHLRDCGLEPTTRQGGFAELGPDQALGAVFAFTAREVPNDPRTRD